jgi:hypothetical protein
MELSEEEMQVILTALEFVENRYLTSRANFVRSDVYKRIAEALEDAQKA